MAGEIDLATAPLLQRHLTDLIDAGRVRLVLDLSELTFCDSVGLGLFVGAARRLADHGQLLHLTGLRPGTMLLVSVTGATGIFALHNDLATAQAAAAGPGSTPGPDRRELPAQ
ncbi:STAS domain-containing protein [Longispora urticae]